MQASKRESSRPERGGLPMRGSPQRVLRGALALACVGALSAGVGSGASAAAGVTPEPHSCGWAARISGDQLNVAFPDAAAKYWVARIPLLTGGHAELSGRFPHARYISFIDYTDATQAIDGIADYQIAPDPGSTNPFVAGANRDATARSYTVKIVPGSVPAARAQNTIYTSSADGSHVSTPGFALVIYRVYEPDQHRDIFGDVGLPAITIVDPSGQRTTLPDCPDDSLPDLGLRQQLAQAGSSGGSPLPNTGLGSRNPPVWVRYTNAANGVATGALDNDLTGDSVYPPVSGATDMAPSGGFFENIHNAYMTSYYSAGFGAVLAYRGRAPLTPATLHRESTMGSGELRYWSLCTNNALTMYYDCVNDDAVAVDANDNYTVAISTAANRPANATTSCGVTWLPAGPTPQSVVILRNMLPAPGFANAIQNAPQGKEVQTLGPYYPHGTYYKDVADFERLGCQRPASIGPLRAGQGASRSGHAQRRPGATCTRRLSVVIALAHLHGRLPLRATIRLTGRSVRLVKPRHSHIRLALRAEATRGGRLRVRVVERFAGGRTLRFARSYATCSLR